MLPLAPWQNFYVIVGSAAGGLTGLQFVAMALIADMSVKPGEVQTGQAFATPAIVHFVTVLLLAATVVMPWRGLTKPGILWAAGGAAGVLYMLYVASLMAGQTTYKPVWEDWLFRAVTPSVAYLGIAIAGGLSTGSHPREALFGLAGAALLLLAIAIENAWDNVTYLVFIKRREAANKQSE